MKKLCLLLFLLSFLPLNAQDWEWVFGIVNNKNTKSISCTILEVDNDENVYLMMTDYAYSDPPAVSFNQFSFNNKGLNDLYITKLNKQKQIEWIIQTGGLNINTTSIHNSHFRDRITSSFYSESEQALYVTGYTPSNRLYINEELVINSSHAEIDFLMKIKSNGEIAFTHQLAGFMSEVKLVDQQGFIYLTGTNNTAAIMPFMGDLKGSWIAKLDNQGNYILLKQPFVGTNDLSMSSGVSLKYDKIIEKNGSLWVNALVQNDTLYYNQNEFIDLEHSPQMSTFEFDYDLNYKNFIVKRVQLPENFNTFVNYPDSDEYIIYGRCNLDSTFNEANIYPNYGLNWCIYSLNANNQFTSVVMHKFDSLFLFNSHLTYSTFSNAYYLRGLLLKHENLTQFNSFEIEVRNRAMPFILRFNENGKSEGLRIINEGDRIPSIFPKNGNIYLSGTFRKEIQLGSHYVQANQWNWNTYVAKIPEFRGYLRNKNQLDEERLLVFPNPGECNFSINIPANLSKEKQLNLLVSSSDGRRIIQQQINPHNGQIQIDITNTAAGIYYIQLSSAYSSYFGKLIKMQ